MDVKFSIRFFTGILIVTGMLLVIIGIHDYHAQRAVNGLKERYLQIEQLKSQIIHDDEIMTMSARMAAATGDMMWVLRYREYEPKLTAAIKQAIVASPEIYRKETDRTNIGKVQLLGMEHKAFALIQERRNKEAMDILFGAQYEAQRNKYERAIERLNVLLKEQMDAALAVENSKAYLSQVSFITVFILLLLSWLALLRIARGAQEALIELNKTLDQKVQERTRDLQNVQSQLLQSEKFSAIGQLAAGMAHEINNPIGFINSNLQTLEKYVAHYTPLRGYLDQLGKALCVRDYEGVSRVITSWEKASKETNFQFIEGDIINLLKESREGTESMRKIVADLCAFASPDKGKENSVDLEALMESMLNIVWNEIKYKAQLRKDYGAVPPVICNPQKMGQVFVNLLTNAAHAIKDKGTITIKTCTRDRCVCVDISDTGCGIPPENINRIFDPFFTTKPVGRGVGLGLSISYDIIRRHGGSITFSSQVDKGTTFTVMLPANGEGI
jgi:signal transduction histidine kinase